MEGRWSEGVEVDGSPSSQSTVTLHTKQVPDRGRGFPVENLLSLQGTTGCRPRSLGSYHGPCVLPRGKDWRGGTTDGRGLGSPLRRRTVTPSGHTPPPGWSPTCATRTGRPLRRTCLTGPRGRGSFGRSGSTVVRRVRTGQGEGCGPEGWDPSGVTGRRGSWRPNARPGSGRVSPETLDGVVLPSRGLVSVTSVQSCTGSLGGVRKASLI